MAAASLDEALLRENAETQRHRGERRKNLKKFFLCALVFPPRLCVKSGKT
jgi:hypothetical protein